MSNLPRVDVHQHVWTQPLVDALAARRELPFVRFEHDLAVLYLEDERPYVIDRAAESQARRRRLLELDGLDRALVALSSPVGIEWLPREESVPVLDAYHDGALALGEDFGVWGALALDAPGPDDVDALLDRGCVGISLSADALAGIDALAVLGEVLERLETRGAPVLVHPGPGGSHLCRADPQAFRDPLWWPALTSYVAQMHAAWLAFAAGGRAEHPKLRVVFSMLAGLAPLHAERLRSRGGREPWLDDPLIFYDTASYGPRAVRALAAVVGSEQLLYGSDRPVVEPAELGMPGELDWQEVAGATGRAFARGRGAFGEDLAAPARPPDLALQVAR